MGVCCIVFDIDGMLFEFFLFNISCFLSVLCYFQHQKKIAVRRGEGGGGGWHFFWKSNSFSFHFTFYAIFNIKKKY